MSNWVSVSDRLPDYAEPYDRDLSVNVLFYYQYQGQDGQDVGLYDFAWDRWYARDFDGELQMPGGIVKYWMPLPEPPEAAA